MAWYRPSCHAISHSLRYYKIATMMRMGALLTLYQMVDARENRHNSHFRMLRKCYDNFRCSWLKYAKYKGYIDARNISSDYGSEGYRFNSCQVRHYLGFRQRIMPPLRESLAGAVAFGGMLSRLMAGRDPIMGASALGDVNRAVEVRRVSIRVCQRP